MITTLQDVQRGLDHLMEADPRLVAIAKKAGPLPLRLQEPGFPGMVQIILSQMVSRASATALWQRLLNASDGMLTADFILNCREETLRTAGLSGAKITTIQRLADAVQSGNLDLLSICHQPAETAMADLTAIKGIGPWTSEIYLMFAAGHADIFPVGDIALQNAVAHALNLPVSPKGKALAEVAMLWSPWRSVAARLFWAYYASVMQRSMLPVA